MLNNRKFISFSAILLWLLGVSCEGDTENKKFEYLSIPKNFYKPIFPDDNAYNDASFLLGRALFYDTRLSKDSSISCASCHKPELAFSDDASLTSGVFGRGGTRNVPTLTNVAYQPYFLKEGSLNTLEKQVLVPIQEHNEFDMDMPIVVSRLSQDSLLQKMSQDAYQRPIDAFVITRSIATFERSLLSGQSKYDMYLQGKASLTNEEKMGLSLFASERLLCNKCHGGQFFTNFAFENNGLYTDYKDIGRMRFTDLIEDQGRFKVPTLRNIEVTAPYMHDGSISSLEQMIDHYNSGGKNHPNKSPLIQPLYLTEKEKNALVAFLKTLTDHKFLTNEDFKNQ